MNKFLWAKDEWALTEWCNPTNIVGDFVDDDDDYEVYEFYNVLWVEWLNGVASRKALGRVSKDAWERNRPQVASITLG